MGRKLDLTSSPLPPPFLAVVTAMQNFTQKNQISKIERRKGNGNYKIFEIEREISFSTLDFFHKIEMPGLSSTRCIHRWTRNWGMPPILPLFDLAGGRANPLSVAAICTSPIKSRGDVFDPCCQTKISSVFSSSRCFCGDSCSIRAMFGLEGRMFKWPKRSDSCFVNPLSSILEKHLYILASVS